MSETELRELVAAAASSASARTALSEVTEVDGRRVDLGPALVEDTSRTSRLRALEAPAIKVDGRRLAERARTLRDRPREASGTPWGWIPFSGGGFGWRALSVALAIVGVAFAAAVFVSRRRGVAVRSPVTGDVVGGSPVADPDELEGRASQAEKAGDSAAAIRLRFQAGLIRLGRSGKLDYRPSLTTQEASEQLDSPLFDPLASTFEEVTYGGRDATGDDLLASRETWPKLTGKRP